MITKITDKFIENSEQVKQKLREGSNSYSYVELVKLVLETVKNEDAYRTFDTDRIHQIDDGEYQGTLVYVIGAKGYQPNDYWYVKVGYGSCSGCDTLESIRSYQYDQPPTEEQIKDYYTLALHIVQGLHKMGDIVA